MARLAAGCLLIISGGLATALASAGTAAASGPVYTVTATVDLGQPNSWAVATDPSSNTIFAVDREVSPDGTLSIVNGATNAVTNVTVGSNPWDVAVDPTTGTAYVANANSADVSVVSEATDTVTGTIGVGAGPEGVAVDPDTGTLYVANVNDDTVSVVDEATQTVTATVNVGSSPDAVAVDPSTDTIYVTNNEGDTVSVIDGGTNTVTATIDVGNGPQSVAVDPTTGLVYVANDLGGSVSVISESTSSVATTLSMPGVSAVGVNPAAGTLLVAANGLAGGAYDLSVIDEATDALIAGLSPSTQAADAVAANPVTGNIYEAFTGGGGDGFLEVTTPVVPPGAPAGISATAGDGQATVTVTPPSDDGGSPVEYYTVTYTDSTNPANSGQANVPPGSTTIYGLTNRDSYTFTATATNLAGTGPASAPSNAVIPVAPLAIGTTSLPGAQLGDSYSQAISTSGGLPPFSYSVISGSLPGGLTLDPDSGVISGTPSGPAGTSSFTVGVTDANSPPASVSQPLSIQAGTLPKVTISSSLNPAYYLQGGSILVKVGANGSGLGTPAGSVVLDLGGGNTTPPVPLSHAGTATIKLMTLPVGVDTIVADYSGDATYLAATSASLSQQLNPDNTTTKLTSTVSPSVSGQPGTVTATVRVIKPGGGTPTGDVQFVIDNNFGPDVTLHSGRASIPLASLGAGTHQIYAYYNADTADYEPSQSTTFTQVVNQASTITTVSSTKNPVQVGAAGSLTASVKDIAPAKGIPTGTVTFTVDGVAQPSVPLSATGHAKLALSTLSPGTNSITVTYSGDANHAASTSATFTEVVNGSNVSNTAAARTVMGAADNPALWAPGLAMRLRV